MAIDVVAAVGDFVDGWGDGGGEEAVDDEDDPGGGGRVDAEELEDPGEQEREEGRRPGGGAGVSDEGVGEAVAGGEGSGDAAYLPGELEVILREADVIGAGEGDVEDADGEGDPEDSPGGGEAAGFAFHPR